MPYKVTLSRPSSSITEFKEFTFEDFSILTGKNGTGKTNFLKGIDNGLFELAGIHFSEVAYFSYENFLNDPRISVNYPGGKKGNNYDREQKLKKIVATAANKMNDQGKLNKIQSILAPFIQSADECLDELRSQGPDFDEFSERLRNGDNVAMNDYNLGKIYQHIISQLSQNKLLKEGVDHQLLLSSMNEVIEMEKEEVKAIDPSLFDFLSKASLNEKSIFSIRETDYTDPVLHFSDLAEAEKSYQKIKCENNLKRIEYEDGNLKHPEHIPKEEFIRRHGKSPIELVNEILSVYDCNGYYFEITNLSRRPWQEIKDLSLEITLKRDLNKKSIPFSMLSSGEKILISIALLLYNLKERGIFPRLLLLDEIDASLHPSAIKNLLDVLTDVFLFQYGVKILLATHSPSTVALSPEDSIYIIESHNGGKKVIKKTDHTTAVDILSEGFASVTSDMSGLGISYNLSQKDRPVLFTEGITDKIILETAWRKLGRQPDMPFIIQDSFGAKFLRNLLQSGLNPNSGIFTQYPSRIFIGLFDFDNEGYNQWNNLKSGNWTEHENDPSNGLSIRHSQNLGFALLLPVPTHEVIRKQVINPDGSTYKNESILTIEHYFVGVEELAGYFTTQPKAGGGEIMLFRGDKIQFASKIRSLPSEAFTPFGKIFEVIDDILNQS